MTVSRAQNDPGPPREFTRAVTVGHQSFKLGANGGAKVKAVVGASHPPTVTYPAAVGNLVSGGEHSRQQDTLAPTSALRFTSIKNAYIAFSGC